MRWVDGNDKVKALSAIGHQTLHRLFAIVESDDYADVQALFTDQMWNGPIEVLPVSDDKRANVSLGQNERIGTL